MEWGAGGGCMSEGERLVSEVTTTTTTTTTITTTATTSVAILAQGRGHLWLGLEPMTFTSSAVGLVLGHTCPARVASCFRGRRCPYRKRNACWFGRVDDLEGASLCRDAAATSALPVRTGEDR